jgi:acetyl-CoA acetyltransferase
MRRGYEEVAIAVPVTIPYVRHSSRSAHWFAARALSALLEKSGLEKRAVDGLCFSSFTSGPDNAVAMTQHLGLTVKWLDHIPMGGVSGIVALRRALRAVQCGDASVVACIAADTNSAGSFRSIVEDFSQFSRDAVFPYGAGGANASFALLTDYYMRTFGARAEDFGKMCVEQRENARHCPYALLRKPLTLDEYLTARPIAEPLRLFDCVMPCAGAEAFLIMPRQRAEQLRLPHAVVLGATECHNPFPDDPIQTRGGWALDRDELFAQAGVSREAIDVVQTYDDYPVMSVIQLEDLGFCAKGGGAEFIRGQTLTTGGSFPLNTSGGQLSAGQAGTAGGFIGITESVRQVTGTALGAQVPDARLALVSGFGMMVYDRGLCSGAAILERAS